MSRKDLLESIEVIIKDLDDLRLEETLSFLEKLSADNGDIVIASKISGEVEVKPDHHGNADIRMRGLDIYFSSRDIEKISDIYKKSGNSKKAVQAIYTWMAGNRIDIINNAQLTGPGDAILNDLLSALELGEVKR